MKFKLVAVVLCLSLSVASLAAEKQGFAVKYDGGSIANLKTGTDFRINPTGTVITLTKGKEDLMSIPAASITEISYGQDVHRRVGAARPRCRALDWGRGRRRYRVAFLGRGSAPPFPKGSTQGKWVVGRRST